MNEETEVDEKVAEALRNAVHDNKPHDLRLLLRQYPHLVNSTKIFADGMTLLHVAADEGCEAVVDVLLNEFHARADIFAEAGGDYTDLADVLPIHFAAHSNHGGIVRKLASVYPAGVNETDGIGLTPLQEAITADAEEAACALLECGELDFSRGTEPCHLGSIDLSVNPDVTTDDIESGTTSQELAEILKKPHMVELLRREVRCSDGKFHIQKLGRNYWLTEDVVAEQDPDLLAKDLEKLSIGDLIKKQDARRPRFVKHVRIPAGAHPAEIIVKLVTKLLYESRGSEWGMYQKAIEMLHPAFKNYTREHYVKYLDAQEKTVGNYWGEDFSDDSDEVNDEKLRTDEPPEILSTIRSLQTKQFWIDTRRSTATGVGLENILKLTVETFQAVLKQGKKISQDWILTKLTECQKRVTDGLAKRAELPYKSLGKLTAEQEKAKEQINKIIKTSREAGKFSDDHIREIRELCEQYKIFIPQFRGINYMVDRWDTPSRRYHRTMVEVGLPQHSETVLKTLPFNFYTELNKEHDYSEVRGYQDLLAVQDELVRDFLFRLRDASEACVDYSDRAKNTPYVFNNILERLQHSYSNGVDAFLAELRVLREAYSDVWGKLPNACNPFVSTGHGVYHCLKYAYGMKEYYGEVLLPRYHRDGKIEYSHLGKVYGMLYRFDDILFRARPNNVPQLEKEGRVRIDNYIGPEKEISFLGFVDGANVVYQYVAKFPDFSSEKYKPVYELKYGLNSELYRYFRFLIINTVPGTRLRNAVVELLHEWLCGYHEILLNRIMLKKVKDDGGVLFFWGEDGLLTDKPTLRLLRGGPKNESVRQETHYFRQKREVLGGKLRSGKKEVGAHGFVTVPQDRFKRSLEEVTEQEMYARLKSMKQSAYKLTAEQHANFSQAERRFSSSGFTGNSPFFSTPQPKPTHSPQIFSQRAFSEGGAQRKKAVRSLPFDAPNVFDDEMRQARMQSLRDFQAAGNEPRNLYGLEPHNLDYEEGDCLFVGVAAEDVQRRTHEDLRRELVRQVQISQRYRRIIEETLLEQDVRDHTLHVNDVDQVYDSVQQYLAYMSRQRTWGRDVEIQILADILQRPIVLLTPNNDNDVIFEEATYAHHSPIFLNLVNRNHFQPLRVPNGIDRYAVLDQIRRNIQQHRRPDLGF